MFACVSVLGDEDQRARKPAYLAIRPYTAEQYRAGAEGSFEARRFNLFRSAVG